MKIYRDIAQISPEWDALRIGSIGGSTISDAVSVGTGRKTLMYKLVGEILSGEKAQLGFKRKWIDDGIKYEPEALYLYQLRTGATLERVGLIKHSDHKHCSPDSLVDSNGLSQVKVVIPSTFVALKDKPKIDTGYRRQMQWELFISERDWNDYTVYCPHVEKKTDPLIITRVARDEKEIKELNEGADKLIDEMHSLLIRVLKGG